MRLYHKYYRQKNPGRRRASLRGEKKEMHAILMTALKESSGRRRNPKWDVKWGIKKAGPGRSIDAFNLLGKLNKKIEELECSKSTKHKAACERLIAMRDTVAARIEGYLDEEALDYSLSEALRDMTAAQVRTVREMIEEAGGEVTPEERREIDISAKRHPSVRRARERVKKAERVEDAFRTALRRGRLSDTEFLVGPERLAAMEKQQRGAQKELGRDIYRPADMKLWKSVEEALEKKYPDRFVPTTVASRQRDELKLLIEINHKDTSATDRRRIKKRLQTALTNRWRTAMILAYEAAGGRELTRREIKLREAQRMRELGVPFPLGAGFFGVIMKPKKKEESGCAWHLVDKSGFIYMSGSSTTKASASRDVAIAFRVISNLADLDDRAGWDNLPDKDRRWLDDKRPELSKRVARVLLQNINETRRVSKSTAQWIVSAADVPKFSPKVEGEKSMAQSCKGMTLGEERVFPGTKNAYHIHVKKGARGRFTFFVVTKEGKESQKRRTTDCDEVLRKGHLLGGAMTGAFEVARAINNPAKMRRLENAARKYFRKQNPKLPRQAAEEGDIRELAGMIGVPDNPEDAYRYGFYSGIIRGIDTCGVQNYFKRRRIRNEFQERLLQAAMETTARVTGTRSGKSSRRKRKRSSVDDVDAELASILASVGE